MAKHKYPIRESSEAQEESCGYARIWSIFYDNLGNDHPEVIQLAWARLNLGYCQEFGGSYNECEIIGHGDDGAWVE
jgi:hypothetical protein